MTENLSKKVERAIKLLQSIPQHNDEPIEIAYSGGKDSDVILELARMAKINFKAIYKCTTIDPPGTIKHCMENGVQIIRPQQTFFQLVVKKRNAKPFYAFLLSRTERIPNTLQFRNRREKMRVTRTKRTIQRAGGVSRVQQTQKS